MLITVTLTYTAEIEASSKIEAKNAFTEIAKTIHTLHKNKDIKPLDYTFNIFAEETMCESCWNTKENCSHLCDCCGKPIKGHPVY